MRVCVSLSPPFSHTHCENFFPTFDLLSLSDVEARREQHQSQRQKTFYISYSLLLLYWKTSIIFQSSGFLEPEVYLVATATSTEHHILKQKFLGCNSSCFQTSYSKAEVFLVVATIASKHYIPSRYYLGSNNKLLPSIIEFLCSNNKSLLSIIIQSRSFLCCNNKLLTIHFCCISGSCKKRDDKEKGSGEFLVVALHLKLFVPHAYLQFQ